MLTPGTRLGSYDILSLIGAGGMGEVYEARDTRLGRTVAIKVLRTEQTDPHATQRFEQEARAIAALNHPHICTLHDVGRQDDVEYLVMERLEGETLQQRLARGALSADAVVEIGIALADALVAAHARGIVHRDIKPANVFLTSRGPKFVDFGIAKALRPTPPFGSTTALVTAESLTSPGTTPGTVAYMSPEQLRGEPVDARSDLFSLGLVLYEMATGQHPFAGTTPALMAARILEKPVESSALLRRDLPPRLADIILRAVEKSPDERFQTAADLRAELRRLHRDTQSGANAVVVPRSRINRPVLITVATVIVGAVLLAGWVLTRPSDERDAAVEPPFAMAQITNAGDASQASISQDGKYIAYLITRSLENGDELWVQQEATGSAVRLIESQKDWSPIAVTVSPDGAFVDFVRSDRNRPRELWRIPFLGGTPRQLLRNVWSAIGWSPDGTQFAFIRADQGSGETALVLATAAGREERVIRRRQSPSTYPSLSNLGNYGPAPTWSPDGRRIAVPAALEGRLELAIVNVDTGDEETLALSGGAVRGIAWFDTDHLIVNQPDLTGAPSQLWSVRLPDGQRRRLTSDLNGYAGLSISADRRRAVVTRLNTRLTIWVGDGAGANLKRLSEPAPVDLPSSGLAKLTWTGNRVVFTGGSAQGLAVYVLPPDGRPFPIDGARREPAASPDGQTLVWVGRDGSLWKSDPDGRSAVVLISGRGARQPRITPDGRHVVYVDTRSIPYRMPLAGGAPTRIVDRSIGGNGFDISPAGEFLYSVIGDRAMWKRATCPLMDCRSPRIFDVEGAIGGPVRWAPDGALAFADRSYRSILKRPANGGPPIQIAAFGNEEIADFEWSADGKQLAVSTIDSGSEIVSFEGLRP